MRKITAEKRTAVISALVEGNSIASTCRMCGVAKLTVLRLLADIGSLCQDYHDWKVRDLSCKRLQFDEIWSFCGCKEANKKKGAQGDGDIWTWTAIDADTKLVAGYKVGHRNMECAVEFVGDVSDRLKEDIRTQVTTDGLNLYLEAVENAFGGFVDFAQLIKIYGADPAAERRYSPAICIGAEPRQICGNPDPVHISTSYAERSNLTIRMSNRRFTRLTNAFSKKWRNHEHAIALHFFHYNWCRKHQTLKTTPAIAAGLTDRVWTVADQGRTDL